VESELGEGVRSPVGIPKSYQPTDLSTHELLRVELGDFAGPLDLLLFLIRQHDIDIFDIPIAFITERYLAMLDTLGELPIEVAAEFLVMAAELTHIKSKMLLPPKEGVAVETSDEDEGDPRADLVRRLLEYQKYRDVARDLADRDRLERDVFAREVGLLAIDEDFDPGFRDVSIFRLVQAMADVLARFTPEVQHEVVADRSTIADRIDHIQAHARVHGKRFPFLSLFEGLRSRGALVMTFLAILELAKLEQLKVSQEAEAEDGTPGAIVIEMLEGSG